MLVRRKPDTTHNRFGQEPDTTMTIVQQTLETDPLLRRVERTAVVACGVMASAALVLTRGRPNAAVGVLGGGLLIGVSYWAIKGGISALATMAAGAQAQPPRLGWTIVKLSGRYALLGFLAYVMIARLRLHPVGLLAGVSSVVAAVSVEAVRFLRKKP
jgi:hypothetical protein